MDNQEYNTCSFCHKHKDEVRQLIVADQVAICNECVELCESLIHQTDTAQDDTNESNSAPSLNPRDLKAYLDEFVIGQDSAKVVLSVAIANHYKRLNNKTDIELDKANVLMIGPTGSGKTLLVKSVAKYLNVPFAIADATSVTEAGYVGDDVESLVAKLLADAGGDVERCQRGIVFIDEIDKISRKSENTSITRDVSGEGVQQALLKMVEGTVCRVPPQGGRKHPSGDMVDIDTSNILFIAGGAFVGLQDIVNSRLRGSGMGFTASVKKNEMADLALTTPDDLVKFGLIPEFVGRFPSWVTLNELSVSDLIHVLTEVKNSLIAQYQHLFEADGITLEFTPAALAAIAQRTIDMKTGARGLHNEVERILMVHMFNLYDYVDRGITKVTIDIDQVNTPNAIVA